MSPPTERHPASERLRAFRLGLVAEEEQIQIAAHLEECPACCDVLEVSDDPSLVRLRDRAARVHVPALAREGQAERSAPPGERRHEHDHTAEDLQEVWRSSWASLASAVREPSADVRERLHLGRTLPGEAAHTPAEALRAETRADLPGVAGPADDEPTNFTGVFHPARAPDEIGRLGSYRVLKLLGRGGMGAVFVAEDVRLHRTVALKIMLPEVARKADARERFLREATTAASIEHDHIVPIFQVDEDQGVPFIAMPLLKGMTLEDRLGSGPPLSVPQILKIGRQIAKGLAAAHAHGLIHRDVKPANIWLEVTGEEGEEDSLGRVKLLDFGLARPASGDSSITQSGIVVGTPSYMAPEQARGEAIDGRADLFSLGVVLYRLCSGRLPFQGTTPMHVLMALASHVPPPPHAVNPVIPAQVSGLVMELLAKDAQQRPAPARAVVARLQQLAAQLHPTRELPPVPEAKSSRRRWLPWAAALLAAAVLVPFVLWLAGTVLRVETPEGTLVIKIDDPDIVVSVHDDGNAVVEEKSTKRTFSLKLAKGEVHVFDRDGKELLITKQFELHKGERTTLQVRADEIAAARVKPAAGGALPSLTELLTSPDWEWTKPENLGPGVNSPQLDAAPTMSADGLSLIFFSDRDGRSGLWEARRRTIDQPFDKPTPLQAPGLEGQEEFWDPCLSADGLTLYVITAPLGDRNRPRLMNTRRATVDAPWGKLSAVSGRLNMPHPAWALRFSADSRTLVFSSPSEQGLGQSDLWMCRRESTKDPFSEPVNLGPNVNSADVETVLALSADGCSLLFLRGRELPRLWITTRSATGESFGPAVPVKFPVERAFTVNPGALSGDGRTLIFTSVLEGSAGTDLWVSHRVPAKHAGAANGGDPGAPAAARAPFDANQAQAHQEAWAKYLGVPADRTNAVGMQFRLIPPGTYALHPRLKRGAQPTSNQLAEPFFMGVHEVTVGQFRQFVEETGYRTVAEKDPNGGWRVGGAMAPSGHKPEYTWRYPAFAPGPEYPVAVIGWHDAEAFCRWLHTKDGGDYRLPTEAEWLWTARAGSAAAFFFGDDVGAMGEYGWFDTNSGGKPQPVGMKKANPWGLFDVYGNNFELCRDWMSPDRRQRRSVADYPHGPTPDDWQMCWGGNHVEGTKMALGVGLTGPSSHVGFRVYLSSRGMIP